MTACLVQGISVNDQQNLYIFTKKDNYCNQRAKKWSATRADVQLLRGYEASYLKLKIEEAWKQSHQLDNTVRTIRFFLDNKGRVKA